MDRVGVIIVLIGTLVAGGEADPAVFIQTVLTGLALMGFGMLLIFLSGATRQ